MNNFWQGFEKQASFARKFQVARRAKNIKNIGIAKRMKGDGAKAPISLMQKHREGYKNQKNLRMVGKGLLGVGATGAAVQQLTKPMEETPTGSLPQYRR